MRIRMKKCILVLALCCTTAQSVVYGQGLSALPGQPTVSSIHFAPQWPGWILPQTPTTPPLTSAYSKLYLPQATDHYAFFCRLELKIEHATGFPVRFRLGDVEYVDRLEGKRD